MLDDRRSFALLMAVGFILTLIAVSIVVSCQLPDDDQPASFHRDALPGYAAPRRIALF